MDPSEVPRRQPEQRWSLAEDGAERPQEVDGEEKTSLGGGPDQVEQPDPPDRERRDVTQDSQAGTRGRWKAARTENAERAGSASGPAVQCDPCCETGRPATQETHGGIGCRKKDDRGERACRSELVRQLDGRRDLRADSERENRAEAGNFQTCSREASGGDRALPSEPGEHQVEQQEPHGEATRDSHQSGCGQESQLLAARMMLASRRDLPKLPLPLDGVHASFGRWSGDTPDHPCRGGVNALPPDVRRCLRRYTD